MQLANTTSDTGQHPYTEEAFEKLFKQHFKALHSYASVMLRDEEQAEEIVQGVFLKMWEKRFNLSIEISVKAYLYRAVHNECLNFFERNKTRAKYEDYTAHSLKETYNSQVTNLELKQLEERIGQALNELPQQCRTIFQMSRFEELKYREIAENLGISVKTVENQMGKALRILRSKLADLLPMFLLWLFNRL